MSCNEWEEGQIKIPSKAWVDTKKRIREAYNKWVNDELEAAKAFYKRFKGKKAPKWGESGYEAWDEAQGRFYKLFVHPTKKTEQGWIVQLKSPRSPRRVDFPLATNRTESFDVYNEEFGFGFDNKTRSVCWHVDENNRSCDKAHKHILARQLFTILSMIDYTKGTGGTIVGNDEYNREDRYDGGGSNYVKRSFGPK